MITDGDRHASTLSFGSFELAFVSIQLLPNLLFGEWDSYSFRDRLLFPFASLVYRRECLHAPDSSTERWRITGLCQLRTRIPDQIPRKFENNRNGPGYGHDSGETFE